MEFTREQIREFNKKNHGSVAARYARDCEKLLIKEEEIAGDMNRQLMDGRHYLMGVEPSELTVEDALEAFGFGRNGLNI